MENDVIPSCQRGYYKWIAHVPFNFVIYSSADAA